ELLRITVEAHRFDLLQQTEHDRLLDQLAPPRGPWSIRTTLSQLLRSLADALEPPAEHRAVVVSSPWTRSPRLAVAAQGTARRVVTDDPVLVQVGSQWRW